MGGDDPNRNQSGNVIIPDTGAAKYWYVDPSAKPFDPMQSAQQTHDQPNDPQSEQLNALADALRRIGALPKGAPFQF